MSDDTDPIIALLADTASADDGEKLTQLRRRLAAAADADGLVDIAYRRLDSPVGELLLAATGLGLVRVAFAVQDFDAVLQQLADRLSPRLLHVPGRLDPVARQVDEYFSGARASFDLALDHALSSGFRAEVHEYLPAIGFGRTASYGDVARALGRPRAVRAVGTACALNPLPLVVPCHRVLRSDGSAGQYAGGAAAKQLLLDLEQRGVGPGREDEV